MNLTKTKNSDISYAVTDMIADELVRTSSQALDYTNIVNVYVQTMEVTGTMVRLRVRIHRDSYEQQSWARAEKWTDNGWTTVHVLEGKDPRVLHLPDSYASANDMRGAQEQFGDLSSELLDIAMRVIA